MVKELLKFQKTSLLLGLGTLMVFAAPVEGPAAALIAPTGLALIGAGAGLKLVGLK